MRTVSAAVIALSGGSMSEDSLMASTDTLATPYAVLQTDSSDSSEPSQGEGCVDKAIKLDEAASAPSFLALELATKSFFLMKLDDGDERSVGVVGDNNFCK